jgi:hypothetical protein
MTTPAYGFEESARIVDAFMASTMDDDATPQLLEMLAEAIREQALSN